MGSKKTVHVVGTGTIGEPLIGLLSDYRIPLGIDEVTFHKNSPSKHERAKVKNLVARGARLAVNDSAYEHFREMGMDPDFEAEEAIRRSTVVIDCTPKGVGDQNKQKYYGPFADTVKGFLAQGSEHNFGLKFARGINDRALKTGKNQFVQVVSCNTHNIAALTKTFAFNGNSEELREGRFVCIRRASDISQTGPFVPAPMVGEHGSDGYGTHHARDAVQLFETVGYSPNLFSSALKINSQYMHVIWFNIRVKNRVTLPEVISRLEANRLVALTEKTSTGNVFSFGRDHGHYGRILNQTVVVVPTLTVRDGTEIVGYCFTPQDGNSLLSSIAATEFFLYPDAWEEKIQCLSPLFFSEV